MTKRVMVCYLDRRGTPRAWATGGDEAAVSRRATKELKHYVAKRRELGESITLDDFTAKVFDNLQDE